MLEVYSENEIKRGNLFYIPPTYLLSYIIPSAIVLFCIRVHVVMLLMCIPNFRCH